ncbi:hypothetical protein A3F66_05940 [candidate division TM6 bacterium RIFCSPHIGHO2_12_FULL_32_22]|nr:MAG: hypothetical protein A3F66_05940 [candidate division TM6 bacterium RIFCSPHIGHO2_12_FULL_32_22]
MSLKKIKNFSLSLLVGLIALPGCSFLNKKDKEESKTIVSGEVLVSADGKPILTEQEFNEFLDQAAEADPQAKMMLSMMPEAIREQALEVKKRAATISEWAKREGVRETQEYKNKHKLIMQSVQESLDNEAFMKKHKVEVADQDAKTFYEENKTKDPRFMISQAGTKTFGVEFASKEKADEYLEKIKNKISSIEKDAESKKLKTRDFGIINTESYAPKAIKDAILKAKVPSVQVIKEDNKFWVVAALSKENAKYHAFDDIKDGIKRMLEQQKMEKMMEEELPKYEQKFNIKVNEGYVKDLKEKKEAKEKELKEQFEASQKAQEAPKNKNNKNVKELAQAQPTSAAA